MVSKAKIEEIFDYIFVCFFVKRIKADGLESLVDIENKRLKNEIEKGISINFNSYLSLGALRRDIENSVVKTLSTLKNPLLRVNFKYLLGQDSKDNFNLLLSMYKYFLGIDFDKSKCLNLIFCAYTKITKKGDDFEFAQIKDFPSD